MSDNSSILQKVRDMLPDTKKLVTMLAFMGCVNALSAKTIQGIITDVDRDNTQLLTKNGTRIKITSSSLVRAITAVNNKNRGSGALVVKVDYNEQNSIVNGGVVYHSPVRLTDGVSSAIWDIGNIGDDIRHLGSEIGNINISRSIGKIFEMTNNYSSEKFQGGEFRVLCIDKDGNYGYAKVHTARRGADGRYYFVGDQTQSNKYSSSSYSSSGSSYSNSNSYSSGGSSYSSNSGNSGRKYSFRLEKVNKIPTSDNSQAGNSQTTTNNQPTTYYTNHNKGGR